MQAAVSRGTRGRELVAQAKAERVPGWGAGDDQGTQPASEEVLQMLARGPRCLVVDGNDRDVCLPGGVCEIPEDGLDPSDTASAPSMTRMRWGALSSARRTASGAPR